jgi:hypothetical protein
VRLTIWSHFKGQSWTGEIQELPGNERNVNEQIFRLFNRVDVEDGERLDAWNYNLPSMSVGDMLTHSRKTWLVADIGFVQLTPYEAEVLRARSAVGEISLFGPALHRIRVTTSDSTVGGFVEEKTNDNDDDGYPDGEWVEWENTFGTADAALKHAGRCRVGMSGVIVTVSHNGQEIR